MGVEPQFGCFILPFPLPHGSSGGQRSMRFPYCGAFRQLGFRRRSGKELTECIASYGHSSTQLDLQEPIALFKIRAFSSLRTRA